MAWPVKSQQEIHTETHFDGREVACYVKRPQSVDGMLNRAVLRNPTGDAIVCDQTRVSYAELHDRVSRTGAQLRALGVRPGDRVALVLTNCAEFVIGLLAAARIGAISVPVNVREQTPELSYILNHCGARVLVHSAEVSNRLPTPSATASVEHRFAVGGVVPGSRGIDDLMKEDAPPVPPHRPDEEDVAVILYTSGTTGRPKGAMLTHLNIVHSCMHYEACMNLSSKERSIMAVPASHVTGLIANILAMVHVAGCTIIMPAFDAAAFLALAAQERMTHTLLVPAMYNLFLHRADFSRYDLSEWRVGGYGGAPMPEATIAALAEKLPGLGLMNTYGSTEVTSPACMLPAEMSAERPDSVGLTMPCGHIKVMKPGGSKAAPGEDGEIWIGGPMVVPGYWENPEKTAESFDGGYWKSGDIGSMDEAGYIRIHDRMKDMIIRGGYNIYSAEIENTLSHHPEVVECAVIARDDPVLGEKTHVFVRANSPELNADEVRGFCGDRLADYKIPDFVTFLDGPLPRNANGKILKTALRHPT